MFKRYIVRVVTGTEEFTEEFWTMSGADRCHEKYVSIKYDYPALSRSFGGIESVKIIARNIFTGKEADYEW